MENDYWELKMIVENKSLKFVFMSCIVQPVNLSRNRIFIDEEWKGQTVCTGSQR